MPPPTWRPANWHSRSTTTSLRQMSSARASDANPTAPSCTWAWQRRIATSDWEGAQNELQAALDANPHSVDALLFAVDHAVDAEEYEQAGRLLQRIEGVNEAHPLAWAYRAVLAHLEGDSAGEIECRLAALRPWATNPQVDWLIGRKLSEKYRFAAGAAHQRMALEFDADYLPAQIQLSQDLLRLGKEQEGWRRAETVAKADPYDILAHNLGKLEKRLAEFHTLRQDGFTLRMDAREAELYGVDVLELLTEAPATLAAKYQTELPKEILIEIFPQQQDFAIRTFGLPGGAGFLGVCFGPVITATSPAAQGETPSNWRSVLWHEFCHVVTLTKTQNRMPRWLSEGISVYEERQRNKSWGQQMDPTFRAMALSEDLTPVSRLSSAFLSPQSGEALQFAYYESSMVVEYLVQEYGFESLLAVLDDLGSGHSIDAALGAAAGGMGKLDRDFAIYLRGRAESLAPELEWDEPAVDLDGAHGSLLGATSMGRGGESMTMGMGMALATDAAAWIAEHPDNFYALQALASQLVRAGEWEAAKTPLRRLVEAYPAYVDENNAYHSLAQCHARLGERPTRWRCSNN